MPTYTNSLNAVVQIGEVTFSPLEVKTLYNYIDLSQDTNGYISLTSDAPYYNPILNSTLVSGTDEDVEVDVDIKSSSLRVIYTSGTMTLFLNSTDNIPGMLFKESITLDNRRKISKLIFRCTGASVATVQEYL